MDISPIFRSWRRSAIVSLVAILFGSTSLATFADPVHGAWDPQVYSWPLIPIHAVLTPDSRVLTYGTDGVGKQTGYFIYDIWDIDAGMNGGHMTLNNVTQTDLFCSAQLMLPQGGQVFLAGGDNWTGTGTTNTGNANTNRFNLSTNALSRGTDMNRPRWYASTTTLLNGEVLIQGGRGGADRAEVRRTDGTFRLLDGANTSTLDYQYPRNFIAPDGRVFGYDVQGRMYYFDPNGAGAITMAGQFAATYRGVDSTTAMFRPGRILQFGGNSRGAIVIDITGGTPTVTPSESMSLARRLGTATILPDGKVLATGGSSAYNQLTNVAYAAEIWDPTTGTWMRGPDAQRARLYHSMAVLLPDGRVMVGGGGGPGPQNNLNVEIYNPPYLFDAVGQRAVQATITTAPADINVGETFFVDVVGVSDVSRVTLVKTGSVTHGFNMDQRFVELTFQREGSRLRVQAPTKASDASPGYWIVFVFDQRGVPSKGRILKVNIASDWNPAISPSLSNPGTRTGIVGRSTSLQLVAIDPNGDDLGYGASGLPTGLALNEASGLIAGTPTVAGSYHVAIAASDGLNGATQTFTWTIADPAPLEVEPPPPPAPRLAGTQATYTASANNAVNPRFRWNFDDGTAMTNWSTSPTINHTFARPGIYYVSVSVSDDRNVERTQSMVQAIHLPLTPQRPTLSTTIAAESRATGNARVWVVNQDNNSVSAFDTATNGRVAEIMVGTAPRSIAVAPDGRIWVTNKRSSTISIIDPASLAVVQTIALPRASQPHGLAFAPTGNFAFVALEGVGALAKLDASGGATLGIVGLGRDPRHLSVSADGQTVFVSRYITPPLPGESTATVQTAGVGGEIVVVAASTLTVARTIKLAHSNKPDFENQGRGIPNYLGAAAISPDGTQAWVPSKQDNVARGQLRDGFDLDFQNTVRAISSRLNMSSGVEDYASRIDHDNASLATAAAFDARGVYLFVALETSREVVVLSAHGGWQLFRIDVGRAPQGLVLVGNRMYVDNFMDRTVGIYDLGPLLNSGRNEVPLIAAPQAVTTERLNATVLKGKQFFYDARDARLSRDRYMSCASCHNDGGHDGRVWDLTGLGEGLRNTIAMSGRAATGHGFLHWSGNFDELQDFEGQIRTLAGGTGLMTDAAFFTGTRRDPLGATKQGVSADLDALAAYVTSLNTFAASPYRTSSGALTSEAQIGRTIFENSGCAGCHGGTRFTSSGSQSLLNVGTIEPTSGTRLSQPLTGIDPPTLRDAWATAPYLHDGSAATISQAIAAHTTLGLTAGNLASLSAYVQQIGSEEVAAPSTANGLTGRYHPNATLAGAPVLTRTEAVDFNWGTASPAASLPSDNFSVRWSGEIRAPSSGTYYLRMISDDGMKATLNGSSIMNNFWTTGLITTTSKALTLTAGTKYAIRIDYFEATGSAQARLQWRTPGTTTYRTIPREYLYGN
jgi:YVTN family beta-propeller protein